MPKIYPMAGEEARVLTEIPSYYRKNNRSKIVHISKDHPYYRTSNKGNISEPRLIMATRLGRNLTKDDVVFRKSDDYSDNSVGNFIVLTRREFALIRDWKRLKLQRDRIISKISVYEQYIIDSGIDPVTLERSSANDRQREVDRDREAYERSRRYNGESEE